MATAALQLLEIFDRLADTEKKTVATEILRRLADSDSRSPVLGVGEFRSGRSDISTRAEDLIREGARKRRLAIVADFA